MPVAGILIEGGIPGPAAIRSLGLEHGFIKARRKKLFRAHVDEKRGCFELEIGKPEVDLGNLSHLLHGQSPQSPAPRSRAVVFLEPLECQGGVGQPVSAPGHGLP